MVESCPEPSVYTTNGTWTHQQHCFPATPGVTYYLVIDGTGGAISPFYIDGTNGAFTILPVELTYFDGKALEEQNSLSWVTASEPNNSHFEIELSTDGKHFSKIGEIAGNGTTSQMSYYSFTHDNPPSAAYYRLKQVDYNGAFKHADVVFVKKCIQ